jgi:hypothetical protein
MKLNKVESLQPPKKDKHSVSSFCKPMCVLGDDVWFEEWGHASSSHSSLCFLFAKCNELIPHHPIYHKLINSVCVCVCKKWGYPTKFYVINSWWTNSTRMRWLLKPNGSLVTAQHKPTTNLLLSFITNHLFIKLFITNFRSCMEVCIWKKQTNQAKECSF